MKSIEEILTLGEPVHKWEHGAVEALRNPVTTDEVQPPNSLPIFVNREFPRKHEVFIRSRKVIGKMLPGIVWF